MFKIKHNSPFLEEKASFREFFSFIRAETGLFMTGIAISGYLLFNPVSLKMIFLALSLFFLSSSGYSYNHLTDRKEDLINNKRLNLFVTNNKGIIFVILFIILSFVSSLFLSRVSFLLFLICLVASIFYSISRIKKIIFVKNIYTAFFVSITFLLGAAVKNPITTEVIAYLPFIFLFGFTLNLLGDIRGYHGDKSVGMKTLPIIFGIDGAKKIIYFITGIFAVSVIALNFKMLYPLLPFMLLISFFLSKDEIGKTRICLLLSFIFFASILIAIKSRWWLFAV